LPGDNLSFGDLLPKIIAKPSEAILATNWQERPHIPIFPDFFAYDRVGL
jgi:hypothetical protein